MSGSVQLSAQPNVSIVNRREYVYLKGKEDIDGSIRFALNDDSGYASVQKRVSGLWQSTSFQTGPSSVWVGLRVGIAAAGHHILTEDADGHFHFHAHSKFDGKLSVSDARILNAYNYEERRIMQPDNSGMYTGKALEYQIAAPSQSLASNMHLQTGSTVPTTTMSIKIYEGTDATGKLIAHQRYPASDFPALTEIILPNEGYSEIDTGQLFFFSITSDSDFSLRTNAAGTMPWFASDASDVYEDDLLQATEWITGNTFTQDQWAIQSKKIYECNTTGTQTTSFATNPEKWNVVSPSIYSWETVPTSTAIRVPDNHQMAVHDTFALDGDIILEGTLALRN